MNFLGEKRRAGDGRVEGGRGVKRTMASRLGFYLPSLRAGPTGWIFFPSVFRSRRSKRSDVITLTNPRESDSYVVDPRARYGIQSGVTIPRIMARPLPADDG